MSWVVRSQRPLQLHHLDRKTEIGYVRCGRRSQTRMVATMGGDWTGLIGCGCYEVWNPRAGRATVVQ